MKEDRVLRCKDVLKAYGGVRALNGVTFEFPETGVVAIIGPNGAGKSTLLNVLTGLTSIDAGSCWLDNVEITGVPLSCMSRLGIARTFQEVRLVHQMSAIDNVLLARPHQRSEKLTHALTRFRAKGEDEANRQLCNEILRKVGLQHASQQLSGELSYGQRKLLSVACCLATGARILFLDEPVAGVHPALAEQIIDIMQQVGRDGRLVVFIEHDIPAVRSAADEVIVMDNGGIVDRGKPSIILEKPEILNAYVG